MQRFAGIVVLLICAAPAFGQSVDVSVKVRDAEARRVAVIEKLTPATIAIFDAAGQGGGSGVIVSPDGYAITNFHVVAPCGHTMKCGLPDGEMVDAVLVGLDAPGDIALIKLLGREQWPVAQWGDSDAVRVGDTAIVAGNPFLLADDLTPTITFGVISGVRRYQYPSGTLLEYADCLQTDAAINPGNSGGPLYDGDGRLIGINGRGSFEKRGRVNVGVGYAVSANQVQRFISHLNTGRYVDHATLEATCRTAAGRRVVIDRILTSSDAYRQGLRTGDQLLRIDGRPIYSANDLQNALGTYPAGWRVRIAYRRGYAETETTVRLAARHGQAKLEQIVAPQIKQPKPSSESPNSTSQIEELIEVRPGYVNYFYNRKVRDAVLADCKQHGALPNGAWRMVGRSADGDEVAISFSNDRVSFASDRGEYWINPTEALHDQLQPPGSGGLLAALELWRQSLAETSPSTLEAFGRLPDASGRLHEALRLTRGGAVAELLFDFDGGHLTQLAVLSDESAASCQLRFSDFRLGPQGVLPARLTATTDGEPWMEVEIEAYEVGKVDESKRQQVSNVERESP